jgi:hypothetical protein
VASSWMTHSDGTSAPLTPHRLEALHTAVVADHVPDALVRQVVRESWERSLRLRLDPDARLTTVELPAEELRAYRDAHPLAVVLPTIHRLLIRHTFDSGLIVAVGDQAGRLLWIDGDRALRSKAEQMLFVEGANWSEAAVGTSAPGTALAVGQAVQIHGAEHFNRIVHPWSCSAVPVHDPGTGSILGVIDITGGQDAVAPNTLPLIQAAVAAVEAELHFRRLDDADRAITSTAVTIGFDRAPRMTPTDPKTRDRVIRSPNSATKHTGDRRHAPPGGPQRLLSVLGRESGRLESGGRTWELSPRHAEILTLLSWHRDGLSADHLTRLLYDGEASTVTLRSEMVRLRRVLEEIDPELVPLSRPYRLTVPLELDALRVLAFLERGAHRVALGAYTGHLLPTSQAPGIREIGHEIATLLRECILSDGSVETVLDYAHTDDAAYDVDVWRTALRLLPPRSPKRAVVVARIERIEAQLAATSPQLFAP